MSTQPATPPERESSDTKPPEVGDYIIDMEADPDARDVGRIINLPGVTANNWDAYKDVNGTQLTVADTNPDYASTEKVVIVLYLSQLRKHYPEWDGETPLDLAQVTEDGVTHYAFPRSRVNVGHPEELIPIPAGLEQIKADMQSGATTEIRYTEHGYELQITKLGINYTITEQGSVSGDGPHRDVFVEKAREVITSDE